MTSDPGNFPGKRKVNDWDRAQSHWTTAAMWNCALMNKRKNSRWGIVWRQIRQNKLHIIDITSHPYWRRGSNHVRDLNEKYAHIQVHFNLGYYLKRFTCSKNASVPQTVHCCSSSFQPLSEMNGFSASLFKAPPPNKAEPALIGQLLWLVNSFRQV